eukprot:CAMPEP_0172402414 /NCGR_PEP_ID=MMETSP1061-20121228/54346_1 /TAXON_ID=37318 /ORGANISM="Pseudo-nitzschia pungens, Strain cf. pungens" /LENGTH=249 /DNA_ID=CAMNT_0013136389 /DNA_START=119 /DNA_END=868 /DNA_ORIENTATION=-
MHCLRLFVELVVVTTVCSFVFYCVAVSGTLDSPRKQSQSQSLSSTEDRVHLRDDPSAPLSLFRTTTNTPSLPRHHGHFFAPLQRDAPRRNKDQHLLLQSSGHADKNVMAKRYHQNRRPQQRQRPTLLAVLDRQRQLGKESMRNGGGEGRHGRHHSSRRHRNDSGSGSDEDYYYTFDEDYETRHTGASSVASFVKDALEWLFAAEPSETTHRHHTGTGHHGGNHGGTKKIRMNEATGRDPKFLLRGTRLH